MPAAISAFCYTASPGDIFKMRQLPNRKNKSCSSFWSNDLTWKVQSFWFAEFIYTERASDVKENFPKFLARKDKALATILLSVEQPLILFLTPVV